MQSITITGGLGKDATLRTTQAGEDILSFNVGVSQGYGERKSTNWYRCNVWGKRGRTISQYLLKGVKVTVQGELSIGEYEGKPQFNVRVAEIDPFCGGKTEPERGEAKKPYDRGGGTTTGFDPDLDDDVPFISAYPHREGRVG